MTFAQKILNREFFDALQISALHKLLKELSRNFLRYLNWLMKKHTG
jgi:hypothetical protein